MRGNNANPEGIDAGYDAVETVAGLPWISVVRAPGPPTPRMHLRRLGAWEEAPEGGRGGSARGRGLGELMQSAAENFSPYVKANSAQEAPQKISRSKRRAAPPAAREAAFRCEPHGPVKQANPEKCTHKPNPNLPCDRRT
jgi:hypothetical protein